jgi:hypothetical protein
MMHCNAFQNYAKASWKYSNSNFLWRCFTEAPILDVVGGSVVDSSNEPERPVSVGSQVNTRKGNALIVARNGSQINAFKVILQKVMIILVKASLLQNYCMIILLTDSMV